MLFKYLLGKRNNMFLDSCMKLETVLFGIIKAAQFGKFIIAVVGISCVNSYLLALTNQRSI